jgi:hypothetical protein
MYKVKANNLGVIRISDNANIPMDAGNSDYQAYLLWVSQGNVATPEFSTVELSEQEMGKVRGMRNLLISATDYLMLSDISLNASQILELTNYRQALRDLPVNTPNPSAPVYPVKPSFVK